MRVGIITFQQTNNYGAILQNFALQKAIKKIGCAPETIDYQAEYISKPYKLNHLKNKGIFLYVFGIMGYICYLPRARKCNHFRKLIKYSELVNASEISKLNNAYDCFICGSDQVWNYNLTGADSAFMLDFVKENGKCNSYAASLGLMNIPKEKEGLYKENLCRYHKITVREKSAQEILERLLGRTIDFVMDPCFLLTKEEWIHVAKYKKMNKPYILVYQLGVSPDVVKIAKQLAKSRNLKIVFIPFPIGKPSFGKYAMFSGPAELIGYINNAEYIVTDSFHGTALSIILNKRFFTKVSGTHAGVASRINDLLGLFGLQNRIIDRKTDILAEIDYDAVNKCIMQEREKSIKALRDICKGERD